jgi:hypothetical protein
LRGRAAQAQRSIARETMILFIKYIRVVIGVLLFLTACQAQDMSVASIQSKLFYDRQHGIKRLTNSLTLFDSSFFDRQPAERDKLIDRIRSTCSASESQSTAETTRLKDTVCPRVKIINDALNHFAKTRRIVLLVDSSFPTGVIIDGNPEDVTAAFVEWFNLADT